MNDLQRPHNDLIYLAGATYGEEFKSAYLLECSPEKKKKNMLLRLPKLEFHPEKKVAGAPGKKGKINMNSPGKGREFQRFFFHPECCHALSGSTDSDGT